jgi:transcriptional regulator with XRE-family HTH domain
MPRQKVAHEDLLGEGVWFGDAFYPYTALWRQVRKKREGEGERLEDVAIKLGLTPSALSRLERTESMPTSDVFGRVINYVFGENAQVYFGKPTAPKKHIAPDSLEGIRQILQQDGQLSSEGRTRLFSIISTLYQEFRESSVKKPSEGKPKSSKLKAK